MIVYVESNFILEIVLRQEEETYASHLLELAAARHIQLAFPAFALTEPSNELIAQTKMRNALINDLLRQVNVLSRSAAHRPVVPDIHRVLQILADIERLERVRLDEIVERLLAIGECLPLDADSFTRARRAAIEFDLSLPDAIMYACVLRAVEKHGGDVPKVFVSRDRKAFFHPGIAAALQRHTCRYIAHFRQADDYITNTLR